MPHASLQHLISVLERLPFPRVYFVYDPRSDTVRSSNAELEPIARRIRGNERDFDRHEAVFLALGPETGALFGAFIHRTTRGQAAGGVRLWPYETSDAFIQDGLRLARGMGWKTALAGLWWGGGKGIIARQAGDRHLDPAYRRTLFREYGAFTSSLRGLYVTAEDAGTNADDMAAVFETTRHVTCIPPSCGGSGNPSPTTARGVVNAMAAALQQRRLGDLRGKVIAMQGAGNVASFMIENLLSQQVARIVATDIADARLEALRARCPDDRLQLRRVEADDLSIFSEACDVFAPNALGGVLNAETIPRLACSVVCGAANNQLLDDRTDDQRLVARGIVHVPDFVANRMGIVHCANEQYGALPSDPAVLRHLDRHWPGGIFATTLRVLDKAATTGVTPTAAAKQLADELGSELHPVWPHRGAQILACLIDEQWELGGAGSRTSA